MSARPFPWTSLEAVRRVDAAILPHVRRSIAHYTNLDGAATALRELTGATELTVRVRRVSSSPPRVDDTAVGALFVPAERPDRSRAVAVLVEQPLAAALASRALKRATPRTTEPLKRGSPALAGSIAALLVAAARRNAPGALRVLTAGSAQTVLGELVATDPTPIGIAMTVLLDHDAYAAYAFVGRAALVEVPPPTFDHAALAALGPMPISIPLVSAVVTMSATELAALRPGDAIVPSGLAAGLRGSIVLAGPNSEVGWGAELGEDGRVVLREGPLPLVPASEGEIMDKDALAQAVGDTPVVVRIEVGAAQMSAREWAALGPGDVIATGKRVGETVVLRVAGAEIGRGELVDLDGEIGVRVVSRTGNTTA